MAHGTETKPVKLDKQSQQILNEARERIHTGILGLCETNSMACWRGLIEHQALPTMDGEGNVVEAFNPSYYVGVNKGLLSLRLFLQRTALVGRGC